MILQKLRIKHYKRFRDQTIEFPSAGIFGIVGSNGAGKSTFFETILWTLFGPAGCADRRERCHAARSQGESGENGSLHSRSRRPTPCIRSCANSPRTDAAPKRRSYRNDEPLPFVQGVREVNRYVRGTLLHMTPAAFATTFFTRQKDLSFFADLSNPARVHEMQHLLDLDALDLAQGTFRDGTAASRGGTENAPRRCSYQQEGGRDYAAEIAAAREAEEASRADRDRLAAQIARLEGEQKSVSITV